MGYNATGEERSACMAGLCQKGKDKKNAVEMSRTICCLSYMWNAITSMITDSMNEYQEKEKILTNEKGSRKENRGTKDQLVIKKIILRDFKRNHTNLTMSLINYRKAYDMVPHDGINSMFFIVCWNQKYTRVS